MSEKPLHITVATISREETGNPKALAHDLRVAKAAILYADEVELSSAFVWMITDAPTTFERAQTTRDKAKLLHGMIEFLVSEKVEAPVNQKFVQELGVYLTLVSQNSLLHTRKQREFISRIEKFINDRWNGLVNEYCEINDRHGVDEIRTAVDAGVLKLREHKSLSLFEVRNLDIEARELISNIQEILASNNTYPIFDDKTREIVIKGIETQEIDIRKQVAKRSKETGLIANLFEHLPVFDTPMDELLDLRKELRKPLIHFRAEIIKLSNTIESASWDSDFAEDVQTIVRANIDPVLEEIGTQLRSKEFASFWSRQIVSKSGYVAGVVASTAYLGASVASWAGVATALAGAIIFAKTGTADLRDQLAEIEGKGLYFYYRLKEQ